MIKNDNEMQKMESLYKDLFNVINYACDSSSLSDIKSSTILSNVINDVTKVAQKLFVEVMNYKLDESLNKKRDSQNQYLVTKRPMIEERI